MAAYRTYSYTCSSPFGSERAGMLSDRGSEPGRSLIADWTADRGRGTAQLLGGIPAGDLAVFSTVLDQRAAYQVD